MDHLYLGKTRYIAINHSLFSEQVCDICGSDLFHEIPNSPDNVHF